MSAILRVRDQNGNVVDIPAIVGPQGPKGDSPPLDTVLTKSGEAADAKAVGDEIRSVKSEVAGLDEAVFKTSVSANLLDNEHCLQDTMPKNWSGMHYSDTYSAQGKWCSPPIPVEAGERYYVIATDGSPGHEKVWPIAYREDGMFSGQLDANNQSSGKVPAYCLIPDGIAWVRLYAHEVVEDENPFAVLNFKKNVDGMSYEFETFGEVTKKSKIPTKEDVDELKRDLDEVHDRVKIIDGKVTNIPFEFGKCGVDSNGLKYSDDSLNRYIRVKQGVTYPLNIGDKIICKDLDIFNFRGYCYVESTGRQPTYTNSHFTKQEDGSYVFELTDTRDIGNYTFMLYKNPLETFVDCEIGTNLSIVYKNYTLNEIDKRISDNENSIKLIKNVFEDNHVNKWIDVYNEGLNNDGVTIRTDYVDKIRTDYIKLNDGESVFITCPNISGLKYIQIYAHYYDSDKNRINYCTINLGPNYSLRIEKGYNAEYVRISYYVFNGIASSDVKNYIDVIKDNISIVPNIIEFDTSVIHELARKSRCI